jgi:DNA-binding MarR family transcriptional regulator
MMLGRRSGMRRALRIRVEEIAELVILLGHAARLDLERSCPFEEFVAHEVLLLRALVRLGNHRKGKDIARVLGWTPGRVSQVASEAARRGHVTRERGWSLTPKGRSEAMQATFLFTSIAETLLDGLDVRQRTDLRGVLEKMRANVLRDERGSGCTRSGDTCDRHP